MLCITDASGVKKAKQAQFASNTSIMSAFLIVFASIYYPLIQFPEQADSSGQTILFLAHS